ncbi:hypothetical protein [Zavarzinia sp.]|uniref:hypothetical protein n=1 Tax=Zavarzinia sp. TaxID=2027920 RepID=UPI00356AF843
MTFSPLENSGDYMRAAMIVAALGAAGLLLAGCETAPPTSASAEQPGAVAVLAGGWQVGAGKLHDSSGRDYAVCTLQQTGEGTRRFWLAATPPAVSKDVFIGLRSPDLPAVEGKVERKAALSIDGKDFAPARVQQAGDALSMAIPGDAAAAFLDAFAKGADLRVSAVDLPGFAYPVSLKGSAAGRKAWAECIATRLSE